METALPKFNIFPATADRWTGLEALFGTHRTSCWCTFWRIQRSEFARLSGAEKKDLLKGWTQEPIAPGILAYDGDNAVGWCAVQPREKFLPLATSQTLKPVDDRLVWSIVCYFVAKSTRRQGVMEALLRGAVGFARQNGASIVEGYPLDLHTPLLEGKKLTGYGGYMGIASVYRQVGFVEVGRASDRQLIMRYQIA